MQKQKTKQIHINKIKPLLGKASVIDIREKDEYLSGHLPNTKNIVMDELLNNPSKYLSKSEPTYLVCRSGRRSKDACEFLDKLGYQVIDVSGGIIEYDDKLEEKD
ncbi:MAG TPA: rhodanese-like domain-containing protein [Acholeplasmataceae bacterium]|nr:rhodanese-like domain-containing protein [Acholeplasmataceae bacterium]